MGGALAIPIVSPRGYRRFAPPPTLQFCVANSVTTRGVVRRCRLPQTVGNVDQYAVRIGQVKLSVRTRGEKPLARVALIAFASALRRQRRIALDQRVEISLKRGETFDLKTQVIQRRPF